MRQKFGQTNGLKSGGKMAGIGSDSSYDPNAPQLSAADLTTKISEVSINAYSFLATSIATVASSVKTNNSSSSNQDSQTSRGSSSSSSSWDMLTKNAVGFFQQAAEATSDLVQNLTAPEEDLSKFPRGNPKLKEGQKSDESGTMSHSSSTSDYFSRGSYTNDPENTSSSSGFNASKSRNSSGNSLYSRGEREQNNSSPSFSNDISSLHNEMASSRTSTPAAVSSRSTPVSKSASPITIGGGGSSASMNSSLGSVTSRSSGGGTKQGAKKLPVDENEDFFGSFGVK